MGWVIGRWGAEAGAKAAWRGALGLEGQGSLIPLLSQFLRAASPGESPRERWAVAAMALGLPLCPGADCFAYGLGWKGGRGMGWSFLFRASIPFSC